jgi:fluoroquinolone transport system permease protein
MGKLSNLVRVDLKQIYMDNTMRSFILIPFFLILFVRFFVPYLTSIYPFVADYHYLIMMGAAIQTAVMFGFITAFILLEEKDEQVLQVIRVLPISPIYFILYRMAFTFSVSWIGAFATIYYGGLAYPGFLLTFLLSLQYGLAAPLITLAIVTFAQNKIEGMAYFKIINLFLLLPMASFFINGNIQYIFSLTPPYWTYTLFVKNYQEPAVLLYFAIGLAVYGSYLTLLYFQFRKRVFDR